MSLLNKLEDQLEDSSARPETIKRTFAVIRVNIYNMMVRNKDGLLNLDGTPTVDKSGRPVRATNDAPIIRVRQEMVEIIKGSQVNNIQRDKLRTKINKIDNSLKNFSDQFNQLSDLMHSKTQITN